MPSTSRTPRPAARRAPPQRDRERGREASGASPAADHVVDSLVRAVRRSGLPEYYDRLTGDGLGARRFAMSALVLDLLAQPRLEP